MKILTVCKHGNTRSVALAYLLKTIYSHDVLACGIAETGQDTKRMLYNWADLIIVLDKNIWAAVIGDQPENHNNNKIYLLDVGPDIWFNSKDQELIHKLLKELHTLKL